MEIEGTIRDNFPILQELPPETYIVGGAVRDLLLGCSPADWDLVTAGDLDTVAAQLVRKLNAHGVTLGNPAHPLVRLISPGATLDLTPLEGEDLAADLQRRDFTINALAWDPFRKRLIDPFRGYADLKAKLVRRITPQGLRQDPLRLLRAYRLAGQLQFSLAPTTRDQIRREAFRITQSAGERQREELFKLLALPLCRPHVAALAADGLLFQIIPELAATQGCVQGEHHALDVWQHTLAAMGRLEELLAGRSPINSPAGHSGDPKTGRDWDPPLLKLAILLHDLGKPACRMAGRDGRIRFRGHERQGAEMALAVCRRLRISKAQGSFIGHLIGRHLDPLHLYQARQQGTLSRRGVTRFFARNHPWVPQLLMQALADQLGKTVQEPLDPLDFAKFTSELLRRYEGEYLVQRTRRPLLTGRDLRDDLNLTPGPQFKRILERVEEARISGEIKTRGEALQIAAGLISNLTDGSGRNFTP